MHGKNWRADNVGGEKWRVDNWVEICEKQRARNERVVGAPRNAMNSAEKAGESAHTAPDWARARRDVYGPRRDVLASPGRDVGD
eukprot:3861787-Pleurochrysis_carterae.AAC.1